MVSADFMAGWLRGFFDGEGSAVFKTGYNGKAHTTYYLSVSNTDVTLMATCAKYLDVLGIKHTKFSYQVKQGSRKPIYTLHICRADDIKTFAELVGFASPDKVALLDMIISWINRPLGEYRKGLGAKVRQLKLDGHSYREIAGMLGFKDGSHHRLVEYEKEWAGG